MNSLAPPDDLTDVLESRKIDAEYKVWKKNTPFLYDYVLTHSLEWPSLTCQWLPHVKTTNAAAAEEHSLLLGTHTTGEQNYLMVASCALPKEQAVVTTTATTAAATTLAQYDDERKEFGGFGHANSNVGTIDIKLKVKHEGEVHRAAYMPQNHFVVASRGPSAEVYVWDLSKHPSVPDKDAPFCPQGVCVGHSKEGYSMGWSKHEQGRLCTGSDDTTVKIWDVNAALEPKATAGTQIQALQTLSGHTRAVEDVDWHPLDANMIASVGDDKLILLWDARQPGTSPHQTIENAHADDINCVSFNPCNQFLFATGSADKTVAVWDMRNTKRYVLY
jgi:histone-binding protein RBBP4